MRPRFAYHILSHDGIQYRTTRTGGVSAAEAHALEQFFFGQTNDPTYFAGLGHEPGMIWRQVGSTKALTRVRPGKPDSNGRATLRFETILLTSNVASAPDQLPRLVCGEWSFFEDRVEVAPAAATTGTLHPQRISDVLMNLDGATRVVRQATGISLADVAKIIAQRASDTKFSLAYKSLNAQAPVTVNLVSGAVSESTMATARPKQKREAPTRQRTLATYGEPASVRTSPLVVGLLVVVIGLQVLSYFSAGASQPSGSLDDVQRALTDRIVRVQDSVGMLRKELRGVVRSVERPITDLGEHLASFQKSVMPDLQELRDKIGDIGSENRTRFESLEKTISEIKQSVGKPQSDENKE